MTPIESKLRRLAASLDAAALEALASKGLLRRAQKDLERGVPTRLDREEAGSLRVRVGEHEVALPEAGPARATCSCPANGVCQHVLAAVLFLQQPGAGSPESASGGGSMDAVAAAEVELLAITPDELKRWARKAAFQAGMELGTRAAPRIDRARGIRIRFPARNAECHFVPGGGLDGMIVSGGKTDRRELVVAAVVGFQRDKGVDWGDPSESGALPAVDGAPRTRSEVLESCQGLLEEALATGLSRLSSANQQRWATLAVSALGVNFPRLALLLRSLADEASLAVTRDARTDLGRMLDRMAQAHALCAALQEAAENPRADLVGWHRTRYEEVGHLELVGAAAWPWRTASGYEGLTVLFWDPTARCWSSWTDSRPRQQPGDFNPVARYTQPGPWTGAESPRQLARSSFRLMNAKRNPGYRLSSSSKTRALVTGPAVPCPADWDVFTAWVSLEEHLAKHRATGLKDAEPLAQVVAIRPSRWGERAFDAVGQAFRWLLLDKHEEMLLLEMRFDELNEPAIQALERVTPSELEGAVLVGRAFPTAEGLHFHPFSLHQPRVGMTHLALDTVKQEAVGLATPGTGREEAEEDELNGFEETDEETTAQPQVGPFLSDVGDALLTIAEAGTAGVNPLRRERIRELAERSKRLHLEALASVLNRLGTGPALGSRLLRSCYVLQLHRQLTT